MRTAALILLVATFLLYTGCSGSNGSAVSKQESTETTSGQPRNGKTGLPEKAWKKLDHALKLLLTEGPENPFFDYQIREREGETTYGVLIRTSNPENLKEAELPLGSPSSKILTARLTITEIKRAARLDAVVSISNPSEARLH